MRGSRRRRTFLVAAVVVTTVAASAAAVWIAVADGPARPAEDPVPGPASPRRPRRPARSRAARPVGEATESCGSTEPAESGPPVADAAVPASRDPRILRVVDASGLPIEGVRVEWGLGCNTDQRGPTDEQGEIVVPVADGAVPNARLFDGWTSLAVPLAEPVVTVVAADLPVLDLVVVDGSTGLPIAAPKADVECWHGGSKGTWSFAPAGTSRRAGPLLAGRRFRFGVSVTPPDGYAALRRVNLDGVVALQARRARVIVPVFPAATWELKLGDTERRPVAGASVQRVTLEAAYDSEAAGCENEAFEVADAVSAADGRLAVRGVPRIAVNTAAIEVGRLPDGERGISGLLGTWRIASLGVPAPAQPVEVAVQDWSGVLRGVWRNLRAGSECGWPSDGRGGGSLIVRVERRDGTRARGVEVEVRVAGCRQVTDAAGTARFRDVAIGPQTVLAATHGFLPTFATACTSVGREAEVTIREASPRQVRVRVVDPERRAVPAARVTATCVSTPGPDGRLLPAETSVAQFDGDTEVMTPRTDRDGVVVLDLPAGEVDYRVTLAGAAARATSAEDEVLLVLEPPK